MKKKASGFGKEFREFVLRGNVIDLAVGVIIGGAFGGITSSLVNDVLMPFVGMFIGGIDFSALNITLPALFSGKDPTLLNIGAFITTVINFIILAFVIFCIVKTVNIFKKKAESTPPPPPGPSAEEVLLSEIRDILKEQSKNENDL